jgi:hypothetical protein
MFRKKYGGGEVMRSLVLIFVFIVFLPGCAHKFTHEKVNLTIIKGKTTKQDVLAAFGSPDKEIKTAGMKIVTEKQEYVLHKSREAWLYSPHQVKLIDYIDTEPLKIVFDDNGVVITYFYFSKDE